MKSNTLVLLEKICISTCVQQNFFAASQKMLTKVNFRSFFLWGSRMRFSMLRRFLGCVLCCCVCSAFFVSPAWGQWMLGAGGVFSSSPYRDYDKWTPIPIIGYNGKYVYIRGTQAGVQYEFNEFFTVGAFLEYDFTNFDAGESSDVRMQYLDSRFGSLLAGVGVDVKMPFGGKVRGSIASNVLATHQGIVGNLTYERTFFVHRFMISPSVGLKFYDSEYVNYYYGVSNGEAAVSGLESYEVDSIAVEPYVGLRVGYAFTKNISAMVGGNVRLLDSIVTDSPMVGGEKSVLYTVFGGLSYRF